MIRFGKIHIIVFRDYDNIKRSVHEALEDFGLTEWNAMFISSNKIGIQKERGSRYYLPGIYIRWKKNELWRV